MTSVLKDNNARCKKLDRHIAKLKKEILKARVERNNLQTIVCLVPEILLDIFDWVIYDDDLRQYIRLDHPCLQLSHVCHRWRGLILSTTRFWSILDNTYIPKGRPELLNLYLERSVQQTLSVRICTESQTVRDIHAFIKPIFDPETIGRVKKLAVTFQNERRENDEKRLVKQMNSKRGKGLLVLEHLEIYGGWFVFAANPASSKSKGLSPPLSLASLRTLKVLSRRPFTEAMPITNWSLPSTLVNLSLNCHIRPRGFARHPAQQHGLAPSWNTVLDILEPMTGLQTLELCGVMEHSSRALRTTLVEFRHLRSLTLEGSMPVLGDFLQFVSLPALSRFSLTSTACTTIKVARKQRVAQGAFGTVSQLVHGMQTFQQVKVAYFRSQAYREDKPARYQLRTWNGYTDRQLLTDASFNVTNLLSSPPDVNIDFTLDDGVKTPDNPDGNDTQYNMFERDFPTLSDSELASKELLIMECKDPIIPYTAALSMTGLQALFLGGSSKVEALEALFAYGKKVAGKKLFPKLRFIRLDHGYLTAAHITILEGVLKARHDAGLPRLSVLFGSCRYQHNADTSGALLEHDVKRLEKYADIIENYGEGKVQMYWLTPW